jgi:hypothetical protein
MRTLLALTAALALVACGSSPAPLADPISTDQPVLTATGDAETLAKLVDTVWLKYDVAFYFVPEDEAGSYRMMYVDRSGAHDPSLGEMPLNSEGAASTFSLFSPSLPVKLVGVEGGVVGETKIGKMYVLSFYRFSTGGVEMNTVTAINRSELTRRIVEQGEGIGYELIPTKEGEAYPYAFLSGESGNLQSLVSTDLTALIDPERLKEVNEWRPSRLAKPKSVDDYVAISAIQQQFEGQVTNEEIVEPEYYEEVPAQ